MTEEQVAEIIDVAIGACAICMGSAVLLGSLLYGYWSGKHKPDDDRMPVEIAFVLGLVSTIVGMLFTAAQLRHLAFLFA